MKKIYKDLIKRYYAGMPQNARPGSAGVPDGDEFAKQKVYGRILGEIERRKKLSLLTGVRRWKVAASVAAISCFSLLGYQYRSQIMNYINPAATTEKVTSNGEIAKLTLSDGTKIWLNAGSQLTYPDKFRKNVREVSLEGEAFFEVTPDSEKPFIIHTGELTTRVWGTSFNIRAYGENDHIVVAVVTGKVSLETKRQAEKGDNAVFLTPDQQAVYSRANQTITRTESADRGTAASWKDGKLVYRSVPLTEIIADIQRKYNVVIHVGDNLKDCSLSVDFNNDPLGKILKVLAELVNGRVNGKDNRYSLSGKGC